MAISEWSIRRTNIGQSEVKVVLCDDDAEFLNIFRGEIIAAFEKLNLKAELTTFNSAEYIPDGMFASCDMVFLDIDFEGEDYNGIDIARRLRAVNKKAVLFFVTNFIDYAPAGYEVQAFRYILKRGRNNVLERYILQAIEQMAENREIFSISDGDSVIEFPLNDVSYLEVYDHEVLVHRKEGTHSLNASLSSLEEQLEKSGFLRIHNSYLVNMRFIGKYRSRECILTDGTVLPASERSYAAQKQKYMLWKGFR
jgi:DNA-binding LytR/AlgR family response regulator